MTNSKYRFKKCAASVSISLLMASTALAGCSAKAEKEEPLTSVCGGVIQENGSNPAYAYMKTTIDGDQGKNQFYRYFYDEGWSDEQIHKSFDDIE